MSSTSELVRAFARRDRAVRFRGSVLGWAWSLLLPLATLAVFSVVFVYIFQVEAPPMGNGGTSFPAFFLCGLVAWHVFQSLQLLSMGTMRSCLSLRGRIAFPLWTALFGAQVVQAIQAVVEFALLLVLLFFLGNFGVSWLAALPVLVGLFLVSQGIAFIVSGLFARVADTREVVIVLMGLLYFVTPILYPMSAATSQGAGIALAVSLNPLSWYVTALQSSLYSLTSPSLSTIALLLGGGLGTLWVGIRLFTRMTRDVADLL